MDFVNFQGKKLEGKSKEAAAEAIENNIRKKIVEKILINPKYFEKLSTILDELIKQRREGAIAYEQMLEKYIELVKNATNPENNARYPDSIKGSEALRAIYDNCGENESLAIEIDKVVRENIQFDFRNNDFKIKRIKLALSKILKNEFEVEMIYNIITEQNEY